MVTASGPIGARSPQLGGDPALGHRVAKGDTIYGLARRFGVSVEALLAANPAIRDRNLIRVGQELNIPDPVTPKPTVAEEPVEAETEAPRAPRPPAPRPPQHTIRKGDTLWSLARRYGTSERALREANPGVEPRRLQIGSQLALPAAAQPAARPRPGADLQARLQAQLPSPARAAEALVGAVKNEAVEQLKGRDLELERTVPLGEGAEARVAWNGEIDGDGGHTTEQRMFDAEQRRAGKEVVWLRTEGTVGLDAEHGGGDTGLSLDADLQMRLERPYAYPKGKGDPAELARSAAANATQPPLDADQMRGLDRGTRFELEGKLQLEAEHEGTQGDLQATIEGQGRLAVERLAGDEVQVTLARSHNLDVDGKIASEDGQLRAAATVDDRRGVERSYRLDLSQPEARQTYERLVRFDDEAAAEAEGVELVSERETLFRRRAAEVGLKREGDDGHLQAELRAERTESRFETRTEVGGTLAGERQLDDGEISGRLEAERSTVQRGESEEVRTQVRGELASEHTVGETELKSDLSAERTTVRNGTQTETRTALEGALEAEHGGENGTVSGTLQGRRTTVEQSGQTRVEGQLGGELRATRTRNGTTFDTGLGVEREFSDGPNGSVRTDSGRLSSEASGQQGTTSWSAGLIAETERRTTRNGEDGTVVRSGSLQGQGRVNPKLGESTLGFGADAKSSYRFETSLEGQNAALPLDAERAEAMLEGSHFSIRGRSSVSASLAREALGVTLDGSRSLNVDVRRGEARTVEVTVDEIGARGNGREIAWSSEGTEKPSWSVGYEGSTQQTTRRLGNYALDLGEPTHRAAYDRLVAGDTSVADQLGLRTRPTDQERVTHRNTVKGETQVSDWLGASASVERNSLDGDDFQVRRDPERRAFTEANEAEGKEVRWLELEAQVSPRARHSIQEPITTGLSPSLRTEASGTLKYAAMVPTVDGQTTSVAPPLSAEAASALPRGSEFLFERAGRLDSSFGVKAGYELESSGVRLGASAEAGATLDSESSVGVRVRRLAGSEVEVSLEDTSELGRGLRASLRVGAEVDTGQLTGVPVDALTRRVDDVVNPWLKLELNAEAEQKTERARELRFVLDLDQPEARAAYEDLTRFSGARAIAAGDQTRAGRTTGVRIDRSVETEATSRGTEVGLRIGDDQLYLNRALRSDATRIERWEDGYRQRDSSTYERDRRGLLGREQSVDWEAVWVRTDEEPGGRGFYRMSYADDDPITSRDQVRRALALGQSLGTEAVRPIRAEEDRRRGLSALLGRHSRHGETKAELDVFITQQGIENLAHYSEADAYAAFGQILVERGALKKTPGWARTDVGPQARAALDEARILKDSPFYSEKEDRDRVRSEEVRYWRLTGENVWEEDEAYETARAFADMVGRVRDGEDPAAWGRAFANLGEQTRFDMYDAMAALNRLAGPDEVVVNRLSIQGRSVDIEMRSEGILERPQ